MAGTVENTIFSMVVAIFYCNKPRITSYNLHKASFGVFFCYSKWNLDY